MSAKRNTPPVIAILWGDKTRTMSWMLLHDDGRQGAIATAAPGRFAVCQTTDTTFGLSVFDAWVEITNGLDHVVALRATHEFDTSVYPARIVPKGSLTEPAP